MQLSIAYSKHESISRPRDALAILIFKDKNLSMNWQSRLKSQEQRLWCTLIHRADVNCVVDRYPWPTSTRLHDTRDFHFCDLGIIYSRAAKVKAKCEFRSTGVMLILVLLINHVSLSHCYEDIGDFRIHDLAMTPTGHSRSKVNWSWCTVLIFYWILLTAQWWTS